MSHHSPDVALYLRTLYNGGIERSMLNLLRYFVKQGLKVDLVLDYYEYSPYRSMFPPEVRIIELEAHGIVERIPKLIKYLRQNQPKALLAANHYANEIALISRQLAGVSSRVVVSERTNLSLESSSLPFWKPRYWLPLTAKLFYPLADGIITISENLKEDLIKHTGLHPDRIHTVYNPTITAALFQQAEEPFEHPWFNDPTLPVILGIGRLEEQKDFPTLIRAFAIARKSRPARLMILGDGSAREVLMALIQELGIEEDVSLPGFCQNPYPYLANANLFVLSSAWEGLCNVLIEALALGVPILSTNCPSGPAEVLNQGRYGELLPVGDCEAMAAAILRTLDGHTKPADPAWLERFSEGYAAQRYLKLLGFPQVASARPESAIAPIPSLETL